MSMARAFAVAAFAHRKAVGIELQMLVDERKQVRALLLDYDQEQKSCLPVSERPSVPDVRASGSIEVLFALVRSAPSPPTLSREAAAGAT